MNGQRTNASEAPTRRMISISLARATTASRIVFTTMNSTVIPTAPSRMSPIVRMTVVTASRRSTTSATGMTWSTTDVPAQGLDHVGRLLGVGQADVEAGLERVRVEVLHEVLVADLLLALREVGQRLLLRHVVDPATWGIAAICTRSPLISSGVALSRRNARTWTLLSTKSSPADRPVWTTQKPARSVSMNAIVALAAMLMTPLRQKPCHARRG